MCVYIIQKRFKKRALSLSHTLKTKKYKYLHEKVPSNNKNFEVAALVANSKLR